MAHFAKPWFRSGRGWYVEVAGKQIKLGDDRDEAFKRYHQLMAGEAASGTMVCEIVSEFLAWCRRHRAPGTHRWHKIRCESFWDHLKANNLHFLDVAALKPLHLDGWIAVHPTWNPGMVRGALQSVCRAMRWAKKLGRITESPLAGVEKPPVGRRNNPITPEAFAKILEHVKDEPFRDLLVTAWETGARPQELVRVEARHFEGDRWVFPAEEAKGKKRIRVVHLTPAAQEITARRAKQWPKGPIFRNRRGRPWHPWAVNCRFCRLKEKLGRKFALADVRHSFVTQLLKAKVDPITIGALCGHADLSMIARTYQHVSEDSEHLQKALTRKAQ